MSLYAPKLSPKSTWIDTVQNDFAQANFDFEESGVWYEEVLEFAPLAQIEQKECWNAQRCQDNLDKLKQTGSMPPARLGYREDSKTYGITNGINRIAAARSLGYEAVPAIVSYARNYLPPSAPGTNLKRSENYGWSLAIKVKRESNGPIDLVNVKNPQPNSFDLIIERNEINQEYHYLAHVSFQNNLFQATLSGNAQGQASGSLDAVAAEIARLINSFSVKAWVLHNCKFAKNN